MSPVGGDLGRPISSLSGDAAEKETRPIINATQSRTQSTSLEVELDLRVGHFPWKTGRNQVWKEKRNRIQFRWAIFNSREILNFTGNYEIMTSF